MHLFSAIVIFSCVLFRFCDSQSYSGYSYPAQRRAGYTYNQPYYKRPQSYYPTPANRNTKQSSNPTLTNSYYQQTPQRNYQKTTTGRYNPYNQQSSTSSGRYNPYNQQSSLATTLSGQKGSSSYPYNRNSQGYYSPSNSNKQNNIQSSPSTLRGSSNSAADPIYNKQSSLSTYRGSSNSASDPLNNKQYLTNSLANDKIDSSSSGSSNKLLQDDANGKYRVSKADSENAKFVGADNLENEEDGRTLHLKRRKLRRRLGSLSSPCLPFGRDAGNAGTPPPQEQGRFLWDVNVYNVYPQTSIGLGSNSFGCGGGGGFGGGLSDFGGLGGIGGGGGLLSDPIAAPYYPPGTGLANFLNLWAPGILQNSLAATARPQQFADPIQQSQNNDNYQNDDPQSDPEVDPNYRPQQPVRRPNRVYYDSAGAAPVTPGQLLGGVATTVNGIIQQLTGNVQPVYG